ncbi:hypothetical protein RIF29_08335 [Crotalaria pallida]|uniref:Sodium/hydrogen exchanger n=1 Tax=Crotalaria pallida TaxID=3830 RepID=A0AAN9IH90_CROPI
MSFQYETIYTSISSFNDTVNTVCFDASPKTVSDGFWVGSVSGKSPMKSLLPLFELQAGLLLGSFFKQWTNDMYTLFPYGTQDIISSISSLGYVFFIFLTGVQMDFTLPMKTGKKPWAFALIGLLTPLIIGYPLLRIFEGKIGIGFGLDYDDIYIALLTNSVTMFAVIASLLNELQIQNSELGRLALSTALVMDIMSIIVTSNVVLKYTATNIFSAFYKFASLLSMAILIPLVCRPTMYWIIKHTPEGRPVRTIYLHMIITLVLILGWCSVQIGQDFTLGAFILGLSVPEGLPLGTALVKKLQFFGNHFLLPIFVSTSVMGVAIFKDLEDYENNFLKTVSYIIIFTHLIKIVSCFIPAIYSRMPIKDALALSLILNCKGVVEIGIYCNLYEARIISNGAYSVMIISVMIIASIVQLSVKFLYDPSRKYGGYQRRNMINLKPYSELKIVACIHKLHHISPITDILDLCCPTSEHPIIVDALHLIELVGSSLPLFIKHGRYRKNSSYSDAVILAFDIYEHENVGTTIIHTYTAISPFHLMYEDVCNLALEKVASIVFLPFHKRWTSDGSIEFDDKNIRTLNKKVLEISPCSVGILVTRAGINLIRESSITRLAMIFLSGKDDREGLCLAKRASRNQRIQLIVYHLMNEGKDYRDEDEKLHDNAILRDIDMGMQNVTYQKIILNDGPKTASFLHDIVNEHDYFIVGRTHDINLPQIQGLSDWSEFPELGAIGDYLASPDLKTSASVLVVQQQVSKK